MRHRPDNSRNEIVKGLRKAGYRVEIIERPVDLLVGKQRWAKGYNWMLMEVKTPTKAGKIRNRTDQALQDQFIEETGTTVVTTLEEALEALRLSM